MTTTDRLLRDAEFQSTPRSHEIGDCLVWTAAKNHDGYGIVWLEGRSQTVHRAAWAAWNGPIPTETPHVLHHCDNPPCFRGDHLYLGTPAQNSADREARGRGVTPPNPGYYNKIKTHCPQQHEYTEENTLVIKGRRHCRVCNRIKNKAYRDRKAMAGAER